MPRRGLAAFVVTVLALAGTSCSGKLGSDKKISAAHVKQGMSKNDVLSVAGLPDRTTRRCWIYFTPKPNPHPSRVRICFKRGRISFVRTVVYG